MREPRRHFSNAERDNQHHWHAYHETVRGKQEQKIELFYEKLKNRLLKLIKRNEGL